MCLLAFLVIVFPVVAASLSSIAPVQRVVVVGGTHGNEYTGVWCIKALDRRSNKLKSEYSSLDISTLLANPQAHFENKRFVDDDLNRQFSHAALHGTDDNDNFPKTVESLRAQEINEILGPKFDADGSKADVVIDLHTTTSNMGITVIVAEGDVLMTRAAAYVIQKCGAEARVLLHTHKTRESRPNLCSTGTHGFTIEVGPVPQGVLRHDAVEKTDQVLYALLEFLHLHNQNSQELYEKMSRDFPSHVVPCFCSAPAKRPGEMSGKIKWPSDPENPNFPAVMVHKDLQDKDFHLVRTGDTLFIDLEGNEISYSGSHGSPVHLIFVNEGGYYYANSGTGIGVAIDAKFSLETGKLVQEETADMVSEL
jgi:succinylglutamate desuccinylase